MQERTTRVVTAVGRLAPRLLAGVVFAAGALTVSTGHAAPVSLLVYKLGALATGTSSIDSLGNWTPIKLGPLAGGSTRQCNRGVAGEQHDGLQEQLG